MQTGENTTQLVISNFDYDKKLMTLTAAEKERAVALTANLDWHDANSIQQYGSELSQTIGRNGDALLNTVKSDSSIEVIGYVNSILAELNGFEDNIERYTGQHSNFFKRAFYKLPFVKKVATSLTAVMNEYNTVAENVDKISQKISNSKMVAMRDNSTLQQIFEANTQYIKQIRELIIAAKLKSDELNTEMSQRLNSNSFQEAYELSDMQDFIHKIDKRVADLQTTEYVLLQNLFQIRAAQQNNLAIIDKTDNIVNQVIPIWKNQLPMAIILKNQKSSIDAQNMISETTNKLITKTAQDLKVNSIAVAKSSEEAVISIDTLRSTTQDLISTIQEVKRIHTEGENQRKTLESSLKDFAQQIRNAVEK